MPALTQMKLQRDRFLAFSLAAADLLVEVDEGGLISGTYGATQSLLSQADASVRSTLSSHFIDQDQPYLRRLVEKAWNSGRIEPTVLRLKHSGGDPKRVTFGACRIPGGGTLYVTLTVLSPALCASFPDTDLVSGLVDAQSFTRIAKQAVVPGGSTTPNCEMRLIHMEGLSATLERLPARRSEQLMTELGALLRDEAVGGTASQIAPEKFAILATEALGEGDEARFDQDLTSTLAGVGVSKSAVRSSIVNITLDTDKLDIEHAGKAIAYALQTFESSAITGMQNIEACLAAALEVTTGRYNKVKAIIAAGDFNLHYQPVVDLETRQVHHYEALMRFSDGKSPYETVRFSEETGLIQDLDLSATARTIEVLGRHPGQSLAVNLSGASIDNDRFRKALISQLAGSRAYCDRLSFEITESSQIQDLEGSTKFLKAVSAYGFKLSLDDFGAGAAGYNYLRCFEVDYVKIDGNFFRAALKDTRQRALLHSITVLCDDLKCGSIAEMIESEELLELAQHLKISMGQGYLLGKPTQTLPFAPAAGVSARRQGIQESWS